MSTIIKTFRVVFLVAGVGEVPLEIEATSFEEIAGWLEDKGYIDGLQAKHRVKARIFKPSVVCILDASNVVVAENIQRPPSPLIVPRSVQN